MLSVGGAVLAEALPAAGGELRLGAALPRGHHALELPNPDPDPDPDPNPNPDPNPYPSPNP